MVGLDAWRRLIRSIGHGRDIRLETLRNEVRTVRVRFVIKSLEEVSVGIAKFKNNIQEFIDDNVEVIVLFLAYNGFAARRRACVIR